jgi:hypothetical protein
MSSAKVCLYHRVIVLVFEEGCRTEKWVFGRNCYVGERGTGK